MEHELIKNQQTLYIQYQQHRISIYAQYIIIYIYMYRHVNGILAMTVLANNVNSQLHKNLPQIIQQL